MISPAAAMELVPPTFERLPGYEAALLRGWSSDNTRNVSQEQLASLRADPVEFLRDLTDQQGTITLPDGRTAPRLPFHLFWIWDGEFCGSIKLRFQPGTEDLPPYCLGHVGYSVVPWKQRRGYATTALRRMLPLARTEGLRRIQITCREDNLPSRRVIEANGGTVFKSEPAGDGTDLARLFYWIQTSA